MHLWRRSHDNRHCNGDGADRESVVVVSASGSARLEHVRLLVLRRSHPVHRWRRSCPDVRVHLLQKRAIERPRQGAAHVAGCFRLSWSLDRCDGDF